MEVVYLVAFFYGSLSFISDLISDSNIFVNYKTISEILFSLLTLYFIFYNKFMSFFITSVYSIGGLVSYLFAPHIVDALVWKISIYFSIPVFIYHLFNYKNLLKDLSQDNLKSFFLFVVPAIIILMLLALVEDYLVPEEYGTKKLVDKVIQTIMVIILLYLTNFTAYVKENCFKNAPESLLLFNSFLLGWFGYVSFSSIFYSSFSHLLNINNDNEKTTIL